MLDKSTTQRLRSLPVEAVAERLGLRVVRHKSLCPFHDDHHASLSYSPRATPSAASCAMPGEAR